jgi:predicted MPP superfamily phosphohydrolase
MPSNIKFHIHSGLIVLISLSSFLSGCHQASNTNGYSKSASDKPWVFVSSPDFFNFDVAYPQPQWEPAVDWFLKQVCNENPDFFLVAGDLVDGHWWDGREQIEHLSAVYYGNWTRRMKDYGLTAYAAVGDHELGDDPWPEEKVKIVPLLDKAFSQHLGMPTNGPAGMEGRAYYVLHNNTLIITVEQFEIRDGQMHLTVSGQQLKWFDQVLKDHRGVDHIIVQGHLPVFGPVKARSSSYLMLEEGTDSDFWRLMKDYSVDLYLCGEFHDITIGQKDGIHQIVHGSSWGRVETINYLVVKVWPDRLELEMKEFPVDLSGGSIWNINKPKGPRQIVKIPDTIQKNGPRIIGTMTIDNRGGQKQFIDRTGVFTPQAQARQTQEAFDAMQSRKTVPPKN